MVQKGPLGVRAFRNGFHEACFHPGHFIYGFAPLIMGIGPAVVSHGGNIDKADLEFLAFFRSGRAAQRGQRQRGHYGRCRPGLESPKHENLLMRNIKGAPVSGGAPCALPSPDVSAATGSGRMKIPERIIRRLPFWQGWKGRRKYPYRGNRRVAADHSF